MEMRSIFLKHLVFLFAVISRPQGEVSLFCEDKNENTIRHDLNHNTSKRLKNISLDKKKKLF